jgi:predicted Zn-dependent protease
VQPLPRPEPLRSQEYSTQPVTPENAYATPPGSVPPVATTSPAQVPPAISPPAPPAAAAPAAPPPPAEISRQGNQAVVALLDSAAKYVGAGELDKAAASLERALRIEPRNAGIWHDLGQIRLHQHNYPEAESMATKSNSLAGKDNALRARNWRLISYARRATGNASGADAAQAQAVVLERR